MSSSTHRSAERNSGKVPLNHLPLKSDNFTAKVYKKAGQQRAEEKAASLVGTECLLKDLALSACNTNTNTALIEVKVSSKITSHTSLLL